MTAIDSTQRRNTGLAEGSEASVAEMIHGEWSRLTPAEKKAGRRLLSNYPLAGLEPLAHFAANAGISHPSVLRFVAKLGFDGYPRFQATLRTELEARLKSPLAKTHQTGGKSNGGDFLERFARKAAENILKSVAALPRHEFDGALSLLADEARPVYLLGGRFTDPIAAYAYMHMRVLRPLVHHVEGPPVAWSEYLLDMDRNTTLIVFDIRRYQEDVVRFAHEAAGRGANVVLVTDQWLSPIARVAAHILAARIEVPSTWDSLTGVTALVEALIAGLNDRKWNQVKGRIHELEHLRAQFQKTLPLD